MPAPIGGNVPEAEPTQLVYVNVALGTHGETCEEVLGSGDARSEWQKFPLSEGLLSYLADPSAARSALQILVNDTEWREVSSFYGSGQTDEVFITRIEDDGSVLVCFGDGQTGARLPTGTANVRVRVRQGLGHKGNIAPRTTAVSTCSPPDINSATNPAAGQGGSERESGAPVRSDAP